MIEPRELGSADTALQAALVKALEENAMLRRAIEERSLAPRARRRVGQAIAALILAVGVAAGAFFVMQRRDAGEFRRGVREGYDSGVLDGRATRARAPTPATPATPPAPPSRPAPPAP